MDGAKTAVLAAPGNYPSAFIGIIVVMAIIIIYMWWYGGASKEKAAGKKSAKKEVTDDDEAEVDDLITEIHDKQKKQKGKADK